MARAPLSDLQYAYLLGELGDFTLGGPALFYEEYECEHLDLIAFSRALHQLMRRHEMLRATFDASGMLRIHNDLPVPLSYQSLRGLPEEVSRQHLAASRDECYDSATPLNSAAPFLVKVFTLDSTTVVQICGRLLAIDGFSGEIFAQELRALLAGEQLPPLNYTFREYRHDAEKRRELPEYGAARAYWLGRLDTLPSAPQLPQRRHVRDPSPRLNRRVFRMPAEQWASLTQAIKRNRLTPTMAIGAAFCEVLRHWAKNPDFTINIMYGERAPVHPDVADVIGNFSSTVLLECAADPQHRTFLDRAKGWRRQLASDLQHSAFSGVSVIRELNQRHGNSRDALMPVVFTSMLGVGDDSTGVFLEHLGWKRLHGAVRTPQVSLDHQVYLAANELVVQWDSADDIYAPGVIDAMFTAYQSVLTRLATSPDAWHAESFDLTPAAQREIRTRVNDTSVPTMPLTLHGLFERQVQRWGDRTAVISPAGSLTYSELHERARAISAALAARGVGGGDLVGVTAQRGPDQIAALLGVMMAGAAYVPISPTWPALRREQVAGICDPRLLLLGDGLPADGAPAGIDVMEIGKAVLHHAGEAPPPAGDTDALAYVIFTSGTSGVPKGVMIKHAAAANTVVDINERFRVGPDDRVLAVSEYTFDLSVWDMFGLLATGGAVVVPDPESAREVTHLHELALRHGVTVWNSVPAYLAMFVDFVRSGDRPRLPDLRLAMVSGDWVPLTLGRDLLDAAPNAECVSLGGATEASIWSNYYPVPTDPPEDWVSIPYGYPLRNQRFHVLDSRADDRPDWVPGELYIAGMGLAEGYLGGVELTAAAFLRHPRTGERLYRTGDWGRYWPDGTLEFLGRQDPQVKVNGYRVELTEIEAVLLGHPAVGDAVVVARRDNRGASLAAFVASEHDPGPLVEQLRRHLEAHLPGYMVPRAIEARRALPLTSNGKVDRRLLAEQAPTGTVGTAPGAEPVGTTERDLARIWAELLELPQVGRHDDFFASGGNSLHAAQLMNRVEVEFGRRLPLATLYTSATIEKLARHLNAQTTATSRGSLVRLGGDDDGETLVLVHPVGGDLLCYRELVAATRSRYAVYGLAAVPRPLGTTIEEMAAQYLAEVVAEVEHRPVRLAGWSLGGVIAYEMGRRLPHEQRDRSVTMIDPWVRRNGGTPPADAALLGSFLHNLTGGSGVDVSRLGLDSQEPAGDALRRVWNEARDRVPALSSVTFDELRRMYDLFECHTGALLRYAVAIEPDLPVQVVEAAEPLGGPGGVYLCPLREKLPGLPASLRLPGDHFTLLDARTAPRLAELF